jgi:hypothetical protein
MTRMIVPSRRKRRDPNLPIPPTARVYPLVVTRTQNPVRRSFHTILVVIGWIGFLIFWFFVFARGNGRDTLRTFMILLIAIAGTISLNWIWVWYNLDIFRNRGNRTKVRSVPFTATNDVLGRPIVGGDWASLQEASLVEVVVDEAERVKRYFASTADGAGAKGDGGDRGRPRPTPPRSPLPPKAGETA